MLLLKQHNNNSITYNIIIILVILFLHHVSSDDGDVMVAFARSIIPTPSDWRGSNFCEWRGINCDKSNRVTSINLSSRSLSGTLPPQITKLSNLQSLSLQRNQLSGALPSFTNHASLEEINLDFNNFSSTPPGFLSGLIRLQSFSISDNSDLSPWRIPETLSDSTALTTFFASRANIIGEIPDIFDSFPSLQNLRLSYNDITGPLPMSFTRSAIQNLSLNNAGLSGRIDVLGSMTQLREVWLHVNNFSGPIPDLSTCTELSDLQLRDNSLTGVIPDSLTRLPNLYHVELRNNMFLGPMPSFRTGIEVSLGDSNKFCRTYPGPCDPQVSALLMVVGAMGYPSTLVDSWEGNNACENWKFIICDRGIVTTVNFARQNWSGFISPAFANLTGLRSLLLNDNNLAGTIPVSLTSLKNLELLDISNNNISGRVPKFASSVTIRTSGNAFIGRDVPVTYPPGTSPLMEDESNSQSGNSSGSSSNSSTFPWVIIVSVVALFILISTVGFMIYKCRIRKKEERWVGKGNDSGNNESPTIKNNGHAKSNTDVPSVNTSIGETPMSTTADKNDYHVQEGGNVSIPIEVLREVTNNFSEDNVIGKGGFGIVYKGQLHDGTIIAVKRMESSLISDKGLSEFKAEIEVLSKVRHRNLVALHGFCENGNERLLVYEYMPQGCLGPHLFEWREMGISPLVWNQRVTIALDVARGVEYLHSLAQQSFIHRDLKPSNILLGDDMRAKVSDFGLVKSAPDGNYSLETRLAGTFGYLAPEYAATGRVTTKVDVFAFGVVLMEILTGRKALDDSLPDDKSHLVTWFRRLLHDTEAIKVVLDPVLHQDLNEETLRSILKLTELAGHCTARESHQRPDMSHVVNVLSPLVEQWTPAPDEGGDDSFGIDYHMSLPQVLQKWKANGDSTTMPSTSFYDSSNSYNSTGLLKSDSIFSSSPESTNFERR